MKKAVKPNFTNRTFDIAGTSDLLIVILPPKDDFFKRKGENDSEREKEREKGLLSSHSVFSFSLFFFVIMTDEFLSAEHPRFESRVKGQRGSGEGTLQLRRSAHSSDTTLPIS